MDNMWINTQRAVGDIENLLRCGICGQLVQNPVGLGACEHFFCRGCSEKSVGNVCPECGMPSHVKDVTMNRQLKTAVNLCQQLSFLLLKDISGNSQGSQKEKKKAPLNEGVSKIPVLECAVKPTVPNKLVKSSPLKKPVSSTRNSRRRTHMKDKVCEPQSTAGQATKVKAKKKKSSRESVKVASAPVVESEPSSHGQPQDENTPCQKRTKLRGSSVDTVNQHDSSRSGPFGSPSLSSGSLPSHKKKNPKGETPLQVAVIKGDYDRARSLLEEGSEVNTKDHAGWTPLHEACNHGYIALVELLLDSGAFINIPGGENETPLHDAVRTGQLDVVRLLVTRGADTKAKNMCGHTPMDLATTDEMREALETTPVDPELDASNTHIPSPLRETPIMLLVTGLAREDRARVHTLATKLHGQVAKDFNSQVTHLVTSVNNQGQCPRTLKFLLSILTGKWIVNKEWVETCSEYEKRVFEGAFEVPGCSTAPDSRAPERARSNAQQQLPPLFDGCYFYLLGNFTYPTPSRGDLSELIQLGGGKLLSREPRAGMLEVEGDRTVPYHVAVGSRLAHCSHFVLMDEPHSQVRMVNERLCRTTAKWLMDCIASFELLDGAAPKV